MNGSPRAAEEHAHLALLAVATAVATWCCSNVVIKITSVSGLVTSFYRLWIAIVLLGDVAAFAPALRRGLDASWRRACLVGGALFGVHQVLFFNAVKMTSVVNVTIIGALQPAIVLLVAGRMFGETATLAAVVWTLLALTGTALVVTASSGAPSWSPLGDGVAVVNLFVFTAYFLYSKRIRSSVSATQYVVGMTTVAGVVVLLACLATGQDLASPAPADWPIFFFLAIVSGTLGHFLTNWAHRHATAFVMSIMFLAVPVGSSVGAMLLLDERLTVLHVIGGAVVFSAIAMVIRSTRAEVGEELAESAAETGTV
jgi:drug/metabolite transporter (DMT)-like permease